MKILTAIYDKKSKTIGKIICQNSIEEAIQGIGDALNSQNNIGEWLMPTHREHREDYCLMLLGYLEEQKEFYKFKENGELEVIKNNENLIKPCEKTIIEFTDIELKENKQKISIDLLYKHIEEREKQTTETLATITEKILGKVDETIKEAKNELSKMGETDMGNCRCNNRYSRGILRFLK